MNEIILSIKQHIYWPLLHGMEGVLKDTIFSPFFFGAVVFILLLERLYPVNPQQKMFSVGFMQDSVWLVIGLLFEGVVAAAYTKGLRGFYHQYFSFLTIDAIALLPEVVRFTLAIFVSDFLAWFQHWVKHKVPWFWEIHAVHHSQRQLSLFTDFRFHFMEYLISRSISVIPMIIPKNTGVKTSFLKEDNAGQ